MTKTILVYGDSNAWGWVPRPEISPSTRFPKRDRWPDIMSAGLGAGVDVISDALPGRTTNVDDPTFELGPKVANGMAKLSASIAAHMPLDLVIFALGTNDFKDHQNRSALDIATALVALGQAAASNTGVSTPYPAPKVLILCPPPLGPLHPDPSVHEVFSQASIDTSHALGPVLDPMAQKAGFAFFDVGRVIATEGVDAVHFTRENNHALGHAMVDVVAPLL